LLRTSIGALLWMLAVVACGDSVGPAPQPDPGPPGLTVADISTRSDTIQATLPASVTAELRDERGHVLPGIQLRFEAKPDAGSHARVSLRRAGAGSFTDFLSVTTDSSGKATIDLRLGERAGSGMLQISAPTLRREVVLPYLVLPGASFSVDVLPADTAIYIGSAFRPTARSLDRFGNLRGDTPTLTTTSPHVTIGEDGLVRGNAFSRASIVATFGGMTGSSAISVVPRGAIAATRFAYSTADASAMAVVDLDGSGFQLLRETADLNRGNINPSWHPGGESLIASIRARLYVVPIDGTIRPLIPAHYPVRNEIMGRYARDGAWVYFPGSTESGGTSLWRVAAHGGDPTLIGPDEDWERHDGDPSPSRDGARLVYTTNQIEYPFNRELRILEVGTGQVTAFDMIAHAPAWSPVADSIAYVHDVGQIFIVAADGGGRRPATGPETIYDQWIDWSPDGEYLIARSHVSRLIEVIHVPSGLTVPLPFSQGLSQPAWRP
jgi:hypothetical protein